jgi:hypothetical protein
MHHLFINFGGRQRGVLHEGKAATPEDLSHPQKELLMNCEMRSDV